MEIAAGIFEVFSSDHCPFRYDDSGKLTSRGRSNFRYIATRMPILFSEAVVKGRIDLNDFVALTSTNHAKLYGLYPRNGTIAVHAGADIVLWDPKHQVTITHDLLHDGCDYTPYEGMNATGWPVRTMLRGKAIMQDRQILGGPRGGQEIRRGLRGCDKNEQASVSCKWRCARARRHR